MECPRAQRQGRKSKTRGGEPKRFASKRGGKKYVILKGKVDENAPIRFCNESTTTETTDTRKEEPRTGIGRLIGGGGKNQGGVRRLGKWREKRATRRSVR